MARAFLAPLLALAVVLSAAPGRAAGSASPPDIAVIRAALAGTWQSLDDPRFTRELDADGKSADRYEGEAGDTAVGNWSIFLGSSPPPGTTGHKFQANVVYLRLEQNGDVLLFALAGLSRSDMKMVYLERGNLLSFARLK